MKKFLAVVKHEYKKVVLKWSFLIGTLLLPFLAACFAVVPALIFSLKGEPTRIVIIDPSGKIEPRLKTNLSAEKIEAKARKAAAESLKDISPSQEEQMKRSSEQFAAGFRVHSVSRALAVQISAGQTSKPFAATWQKESAMTRSTRTLIVPADFKFSERRL